MALGGTRAGWEDDAGPRPRAVRGVSDVPGTGVPPAPAPAAAPPWDPLPTPGPPYGPGPNSSQMGWGGVAFQSLRLEQTPLPPCWAVTRPRPLTPARRPWRGPSCPLPRAGGDPLARGPRWVAPCWNPCRSRGPSRVDRRRTGGHARSHGEGAGAVGCGHRVPPWGRAIVWGHVPAARGGGGCWRRVGRKRAAAPAHRAASFPAAKIAGMGWEGMGWGQGRGRGGWQRWSEPGVPRPRSPVTPWHGGGAGRRWHGPGGGCCRTPRPLSRAQPEQGSGLWPWSKGACVWGSLATACCPHVSPGPGTPGPAAAAAGVCRRGGHADSIRARARGARCSGGSAEEMARLSR